MIFPVSLLIGAKHPVPAFSTNHLTDTNKTKQNLETEAYDTYKVFFQKSLSKENFQMWHTHLRKFLPTKVNFQK